MKQSLLIAVLAMTCISEVYAANQGQQYFGVQYGLASVDIQVSGLDDFEPTGLLGKVGYFGSENVAIEGRFGIGLQDDSQNVGGVLDVDFDIEHLCGVYGVLYLDASNDTSFYGVIGFSQAKGKLSALGVSDSDSESGLSYGFGVNIKSLNLEYMNYLDEDDLEVTAIAIGYVSRF